MAQNNTNNTDWTALQQAEDMAYFRAEACLFPPKAIRLRKRKQFAMASTQSRTKSIRL